MTPMTLRSTIDGDHTYLDESGQGNLKVRTNTLKVSNVAETKDSLLAQVNGSVELYHDGNKKVETTSTGAVVTGILTAGGHTLRGGQLNVAGNVNIAGVSTFSGPMSISQFRTNSYQTLSADGSQALFTASVGGPVQLFFNNQLKLATTSQGVSINNGPSWTSGTGSPEGVVTASVGSLYSRTDGGTNTSLYVKESGTGNTGWAAK